MVEFDRRPFETGRSRDTPGHQFADEEKQPAGPDRSLNIVGALIFDLDVRFDTASALDRAAEIGAAHIILRLRHRFGIPIRISVEMVFVAGTVRIVTLDQSSARREVARGRQGQTRTFRQRIDGLYETLS